MLSMAPSHLFFKLKSFQCLRLSLQKKTLFLRHIPFIGVSLRLQPVLDQTNLFSQSFRLDWST